MSTDNNINIKANIDTKEAEERLSVLGQLIDIIKNKMKLFQAEDKFVANVEAKVNAIKNTFDNDIEEFGKQLEELSKFEIDFTTYEEVATTIDGLKAVIEELDEELNNAELGSEKFVELAQASSHYKKRLEEVEETVKKIGSTTPVLDSLVSVSENLKAGFSGAQAAAEFFGLETTKLSSIINKITKAQEAFSSAQKLSEKLFSKGSSVIAKGAAAKDKLAGSIGGATKSFKLFNKAMSASVIGAIITAVATLAAYWEDIKEALRFTSKEQKNQLKTSQELFAAEEGKLNAIDGQENILRKSGKSERQILQMKMEQTKQTINAGKASILHQKEVLKSQIEAEKRNKAITKGILDFFTINITMILGLIDKAGSVFGKSFGLVEKFNNFKDTVASQFFNPEEVEKKGNEEIKATEAKIAELENQAAGHVLAMRAIDKKAYDDWRQKFKRDTENELKLRKERNTLTEEFELQALEDFKEHKLISESDFELQKQKIKDRYDKIDRERIEKAAKDLLEIEKNGIGKILDTQNKIYDERLAQEKMKLAQGKITQEQFAAESLHIETERLKKLKEAQDLYHQQSAKDLEEHFSNEINALELKRETQQISDEDYKNQLAALEAAENETKRELKLTQEAEEAALTARINQNKLDVETAATEDRKRIAAAELAFKKKLQEDTLNLATALGDLLQKEGDKQNKIQKGVALVKIGIDTAKAISSAIATSNSPTPDNVATGGLAGIAKFIAISAQILSAAVSARKVLNSGQGRASGSTPSTPSAPTISAPQMSTPRIAGTPIVARQHSPEPIKVFVSEADIRRTQQKVKVIEEQSEVV
jgi:hypothetical protein